MCLVDFLSPVSRQIVIFFVDWRDNLSQHEPSKPNNPEQRHTAEVWENAVMIPPASTEHGKPQALGSGKARDGREWGRMKAEAKMPTNGGRNKGRGKRLGRKTGRGNPTNKPPVTMSSFHPRSLAASGRGVKWVKTV